MQSFKEAGCLNRKAAAKYLGEISLRKLDELATAGHLPRIKIGTKTVFRIADLDRYIESKIQRLATEDQG